MSYDLLEGVRVIELSMYAFAPAAAAVLSDWGADVVKVVPPGTADPMMGRPVAGLPDVDVGVPFMWELLNRGKRCIGLDVSTDEGRAILVDLVAGADVFITNLLPGARRRYRLDPDDLLAVNPRLVYGRASAHGDRGPEREDGGFDATDFWSRSGIGHAASLVSDEYVPLIGPAFGDLTSGTFLAGGIAAALVRRDRTGQGAVVDVSLLGSAVWVLAPGVVASDLYGVETIPRFRHAESRNPLVAVYQTKDRRLIALAGIQTERYFTEFCTLLDRRDLLDDDRFATPEARLANAADCVKVLDGIFAGRELAEWTEILSQLSTPWTVVQSAAEAARDQQVIANEYVTETHGASRVTRLVASPAQFDGVPPSLRGAPQHGEHTEEIVQSLGRSWEDIASLKETGTIT
ncbi:MAG TPA: CoA transferase [Acidimicrobiales bacterium]|nr:CoA transferase [Acidimicrobiales bacterium]